jgi:hypothetical protein
VDSELHEEKAQAAKIHTSQPADENSKQKKENSRAQ